MISHLGLVQSPLSLFFFFLMIVFGLVIHLYQKKRPARSEKLSFKRFFVRLSSGCFHTFRWKGRSRRVCPTPHLSPRSLCGRTARVRRWSPSRSRPGCRPRWACASHGSVPEWVCVAAAAGWAGWDGLDMGGEQRYTHTDVSATICPYNISMGRMKNYL